MQYLKNLLIQFPLFFFQIRLFLIQNFKYIFFDGVRDVARWQVVAVEAEGVFDFFAEQFHAKQGEEQQHGQRDGGKLELRLTSTPLSTSRSVAAVARAGIKNCFYLYLEIFFSHL